VVVALEVVVLAAAVAQAAVVLLTAARFESSHISVLGRAEVRHLR